MNKKVIAITPLMPVRNEYKLYPVYTKWLQFFLTLSTMRVIKYREFDKSYGFEGRIKYI